MSTVFLLKDSELLHRYSCRTEVFVEALGFSTIVLPCLEISFPVEQSPVALVC